MKIVLGTQNKEKISDFRFLSNNKFDLVEVPHGITDPEEGEDSLVKNAKWKAYYYAKVLNLPAIGDDTGFFVEALDNEPGVIARRWAEATNENIGDKTVRLLKGNKNRRAFIRTAIAFDKPHGHSFCIVKDIHGTITEENLADKNHFGYRGIFIPDGSNKTLSQMSEEERLLPQNNSRSAAFLELIKSL